MQDLNYVPAFAQVLTGLSGLLAVKVGCCGYCKGPRVGFSDLSSSQYHHPSQIIDSPIIWISSNAMHHFRFEAATIDKSNIGEGRTIVEGRTRGTAKPKGALREPGDEEGLPTGNRANGQSCSRSARVSHDDYGP